MYVHNFMPRTHPGEVSLLSPLDEAVNHKMQISFVIAYLIIFLLVIIFGIVFRRFVFARLMAGFVAPPQLKY